MSIRRRLLWASALGPTLSLIIPHVLAQDSELFALKNRWEHIATQTPPDVRAQAFESLAEETNALAGRYPDNAEVLVWQGIMLASEARAKGGLGALALAKDARAVLERAIEIDPRGNDGLAYVALGALYDRVPGWPVGFGDSDTAETMFQRALEIRPDGIGVNYYYAAFLEAEGRESEALAYARRAVNGEARVGREAFDEALREEAKALAASLR